MSSVFFSPSVALELRCMSNLWWLCGILEGEGGWSRGNIGLRLGQHISFPSSMWITLSPDSSEMERWLLFDTPPAWTRSCIHHPNWTHPKFGVCVSYFAFFSLKTLIPSALTVWVCVLGCEVDIIVFVYDFQRIARNLNATFVLLISGSSHLIICHISEEKYLFWI